MGMSGAYGPTDDADSIATIQHALDRGVQLIDTGDFYGSGHNERLVGQALAGRRDKAVISVKFGAMRAPGGGWLGVDCRPAAVKNFCAYSLDRLRVDVIDIYRPARLDPTVPIEDTIGAIADLVKQGYVRHIGLSELGAETIRRAAKVHPIVDLQIEYSIATRGPEENIFPALVEVGASATLYGVFSRGLLTGSTAKAPGDFRAWLPRFSKDNAGQNESVVSALQSFAAEGNMTSAQLLIAWVRAKQPGFLPIIGIKTRVQLDDALGALDHSLTNEDVAAIERIVTPDAIAGTRYGAEQMKHLDSER
jgi:aryl-alcohol dehydrogenase-like predicted oxidoreductase